MALQKLVHSPALDAIMRQEVFVDFFDTVTSRRSVRLFEQEEVPAPCIHKALDAALLAPNSSNLQPWEFYWIRSADKKQQMVDACFRQSAARSAAELVFAVARLDTWNRNRKLLLERLKSNGSTPAKVLDYYEKVVPPAYIYGWFNLIGIAKWVVLNTVGLFRPSPRGPTVKSEVQETVVKTTALACENFMLAMTAQGYATCPMEGFDEVRVKKILKLPRRSKVVMGLAIGRPSELGIWGDQIRLDRDLFIKEV